MERKRREIKRENRRKEKKKETSRWGTLKKIIMKLPALNVFNILLAAGKLKGFHFNFSIFQKSKLVSPSHGSLIIAQQLQLRVRKSKNQRLV